LYLLSRHAEAGYPDGLYLRSALCPSGLHKRAVVRGAPVAPPNKGLQPTASSLRCAAVVHATSPSQMGRMQRTSLGQRLTSTRKGEGTSACRPSRERSEDAAIVARRDPRDLATALLPEVQCPSVNGGPRAPASQSQVDASPGPAEGRCDL